MDFFHSICLYDKNRKIRYAIYQLIFHFIQTITTTIDIQQDKDLFSKESTWNWAYGSYCQCLIDNHLAHFMYYLTCVPISYIYRTIFNIKYTKCPNTTHYKQCNVFDPGRSMKTNKKKLRASRKTYTTSFRSDLT